MAKLSDCIEAGLATGRITQEQADDLTRRVERYEGELQMQRQVVPGAERSAAEAAALQAQRKQIALERRQKALQTIKLAQAIDNIQRHPGGKAWGLLSLLVKDPGRRARYSNIDNRRNAILAGLHRHFAEGLEAMRRTHLGLVQDKRTLRNFVREIFGEGTGDENAARFARMWSEAAEDARVQFNRAGGAIPKREDWGMPQYHDPQRVARTSRDEWAAFVFDRLDRHKMLNSFGEPMTDVELREMLDRMYDTVRTDGLVDMTPGQTGGKKLANRRQDHRVLSFKSAEDWLEYHDRFGHQDIFATLTDHLNGMADQVAQLEVLGPNPEAAFRHLRDLVRQSEDGSRYLGVPVSDIVEPVWRSVSGQINSVQPSYKQWRLHFSDFMKSVRNFLVSARLGSAMLSAISDLAFVRQTSAFNGLSSTKVLGRYLSLLNPANSEDRLRAVKMGLTAEAWITRALAANRFTEVTGAGFSAKAADFTMRASMMSAHTDAMRKAFGMEFMGLLGEHRAKALDELPAELRRALDDYNIKADEWNDIRATTPRAFRDAEWVDVENLMARADLSEDRRRALAIKLEEMVLTETDFAVPVPDALVRATTSAGTQRGTIAGELFRSVFLFKSFPITAITSHMYRGLLREGMRGKGAYLGTLAIGTTALGAVAMQAKEVSRGKDPRQMDDPKFWAAAFTQGGGAGIYGDFLFSDANRFGKGPIMTMAGPVFEAGDDVLKLTQGNVQQVLRGEDPRIGADVVDFLRGYTPTASLWYTRLGFERMVLDQLQRLGDPRAHKDFRRLQRRRMREYDQQYWWRPGQTAPDRAPRL